MSEPILEVKGLVKHFPIRGGVMYREVARVHAVDNVSFSLARGETLGLVGESGCGKSTLGRTIIQLHRPTSGSVKLGGEELVNKSRAALRPMRRRFQMIFQDPFESLNPRHSIERIIMEPLVIHGIGDRESRQAKVRQLADRVGLAKGSLLRYPHEFSGGQRQRIGIARAIALEPELLVCDEAVSALDVSIQSQVLNLLMELQRDMALTYLFISHDLGVVRHVSDRIAVMYLGKMVELGTADEIYHKPRHPYTRALVSAIPVADPERANQRTILEGDVPSPINPPAGCRFHPRCPYANDRCRTEVPQLREVTDKEGHVSEVACHSVETLDDS